MGGNWISNGQAIINIDSTSNQNLNLSFNSGETTEAWLWIYLKSLAVDGELTIDLSDLQLEEGTQATSYEEYGATPSPQFPSTIQNVTGDVNITVANKNMANADDIYARMQEHNANGCSEKTVDEKECIRINNTLYRPDVENPFDLLGIKYKENTVYTIKGMFKKDGTTETGMLSIQVVYTDDTYNYVQTSGIDWQELRLVTNASKTVKYIGFSYGSSAMWLLDKSSIFVAEGDTANYIANEQQEATFPLLENQKLMLNDYLADDGIHHARKQIELDGTENWKIGSINQARYSIGLTVADLNKQITYLDKQMLSNWFILNSSNESNTENVDKFTFRNFTGGNTIYFFFPKSYFTATTSAEILAEWKSKLAEAKQQGTPMTLEYKTAEETTEAYTEEQQEAYNQFKELKTYKGGTNVFSTNEISPIFKVEYIKDETILLEVNKTIEEVLQPIKTSIENLENNTTADYRAGKIIIGNMRIEYGLVQNMTIPATSYEVYNVEFSKSFKNVPGVYLQENGNYNIKCDMASSTVEGFTINARSLDGNAREGRACGWLAIGLD